MRRRWARWVALFDAREDGHALALFRVALGLTVFIDVAWPAWAGVVDAAWIDQAHGGYRPLGQGGGWLLDLLGTGARPEVIWGLVAITLVASLLLTFGVAGRAMALVAGQGLLALSNTNPHARGAYDALLSSGLWLLVFADSTAALSLQERLRSGRWSSARQVSSWPRLLAVFQLVVMYTTTAAHKLSADWVPGGELSALYYVLQMPNWHRFDMRWVASVYPLTQAATLATWLWELSAPLLLVDAWLRRHPERVGWLPRTLRRLHIRRGYVLMGIAVHGGILLTMEVGVFSLAAWAFYPCLWAGDDLKRWLSSKRAEQPASSGL
jgi:hypothetical protein